MNVLRRVSVQQKSKSADLTLARGLYIESLSRSSLTINHPAFSKPCKHEEEEVEGRTEFEGRRVRFLGKTGRLTSKYINQYINKKQTDRPTNDKVKTE